MWWLNYWGQMPLDRRMSKKKFAKWNNNVEFQNHFENYFQLAQGMFTWRGLPDTCDARFMERCLLLYGRAMIAKVDGSYLTLGAANGAGINVYGYPIKGYGWGLNGYNKEFALYVPGADDSPALRNASDGRTGPGAPEAVVCYDNVDQYPYVQYVIQAAARMSDLLRSCDVAVQNLKSPYIISCAESDLNNMRQALEQKDENVAAILTGKGFSAENMHIWPTNVQPEVLKVFWEQYRNIEAQLLETLGINANDNTDKAERLLVDEINANNETVAHNMDKRLRWRKIFCRQVNDVFGLDVSVEPNEEVMDYVAEREADDAGGLDDGQSDGGPVGG